MRCDWKFESSWYGRGSKDIDTYYCTRCHDSVTELEGTDPPERECQGKKPVGEWQADYT